MIDIATIDAADFRYDLPDERIAVFPLEKRDEAKLLIYKNQKISHAQFKNIIDELDENYTIFFNNTRVIPARLHFRKEAGGLIEIFLLHPIVPASASLAMCQTENCTWKAMIGGLKKWKNDLVLSSQIVVNQEVIILNVRLSDRENQEVTFDWTPSEKTFAEVISIFGNIPLPPYLNRTVKETDKQNYQTVYAQNEGAVAAPTAGLHFTDEVLSVLKEKGVKEDFLTLHVGGGTFQPIKTEKVIEHQMHSEQIIVTQKNLENLLLAKKVAAVGTTSLRTLESLYWIALGVWEKNEDWRKQILNADFQLPKLTPYQNRNTQLPDKQEVIACLLDFMKKNNLNQISGETQIMIVPSYEFRCCDALITNFHQPETTLMLLVAAFVGDDWKKIYESALENEYRFLSYGDSSILFR
jgi:S-adenosylmethionine:tRNA ribosyltransferase-isomerase